VGVDGWDPPLVEDAQGVQRARVMQAALEDDIEAGRFRPQVEHELAVVHPLDVHPAPGEGLEQQLLLGPDPGAEHPDPHSPQSSMMATATGPGVSPLNILPLNSMLPERMSIDTKSPSATAS